MWYNNILETIGNTPLVKLNKLMEEHGIKATVLAKIETMNPGNSIKDRMALKMIEDAEKAGILKPGFTIIEGTSGNTGMGLAIAAVIKGYKCIFTTTDKQSREKVDALKAFGAEVIVCPTDVEPEDPKSYYSVSSRLINEIPNSWKPNQYDNLSNTQAHYEQTGPEIWKQTEGKITHLVVGVGTGGTICGTGKYLKEQNPAIKIWGIDTYGSVFKKYKETGEFDKNEIYPYITEGIGEDFLPKNVDFSLIDHFEKVTDRNAAIFTRELPRKEGIFVGNSAGAAIAGLIQMKDKLTENDVVVVIFHDHGTRYLGKMFNDDWMKERGFLETKKPKQAREIVSKHNHLPLLCAKTNETIAQVYAKMEKFGVSQLPVQDNTQEFVGSISDQHLYACWVKNPDIQQKSVSEIMQAAFPMMEETATIEDISKRINKENNAVLIKSMSGNIHIITKYDLIHALAD